MGGGKNRRKPGNKPQGASKEQSSKLKGGNNVPKGESSVQLSKKSTTLKPISQASTAKCASLAKGDLSDFEQLQPNKNAAEDTSYIHVQEAEDRSSRGSLQQDKTVDGFRVDYVWEPWDNEELVQDLHVQQSTSDLSQVELPKQDKNTQQSSSSNSPWRSPQNQWGVKQSNYASTTKSEVETENTWSTKSDRNKNKMSHERGGNNSCFEQHDNKKWSSNTANKVPHRQDNLLRSENKDGDSAYFKRYLQCLKEQHTYLRVNEVQSDLFELSKEYSLAHCVAEDMAMGSGIAVHFRRDFKRVDELYAQKQKQGGLAVLEDNNRFIYYLVTKRTSNSKPTLLTLFESLLKMRKHIEKYNVKKLAMPRIGCGLDRLEWSDVKPMLEFIFKDIDIDITVCNFQQPDQEQQTGDPKSVPTKLKKCVVANVTYPLVDIESGTIIVYLGSEDGYESKEMEILSCKFSFLRDYRTQKRKAGEIITTYSHNKEYVICGFIIKAQNSNDFSFTNFQNCVTALNKWNSKSCNKYGYVGIEAFLDTDELLMQKIVTILRYELRFVDVYVCWPGDLKKYMPRIVNDHLYY